MHQSERCLCLLPTKVCSKAAGELQSDPATDLTENLHRNSHAKGFKCLLPCTCSTWTPLYFAHSFPEHQDQHSSLEWKTHSRIFFSSWQSCLFPSCGKIRFFLWLPQCSWHLFNMRQKNNLFFSSLLPYGDNLVNFAAALPPRKEFIKGGRKDSTPPTPTRDQKAESGTANRITHKGEGKTTP